MIRLSHDFKAFSRVLGRFCQGIRGAAGLVVRRAAERAEELLRERAPKRTGQMAESVGSTIYGRMAIVGLRARYARFLEFGTRQHEIRPRRARALVFSIGGRIVFAKRVLHPGIRPRRFVQAVAEELEEQLGSIFEEVMEHVAR